jgi:hypothetical protein
MARPLNGIRVLELGNFIAGPFYGMLLGDMGADVVKVEPPRGGDMTRNTPPHVSGESANFIAIIVPRPLGQRHRLTAPYLMEKGCVRHSGPAAELAMQPELKECRFI